MKHLWIALLAVAAAGTNASARDWIHWRGPEQNGVSREKNLPAAFDPKLGAKGNVVWQQPFGGRSAPLVMDGKLYIIQGVGEGLHEGEQVLCFDEKTGAKQWAFRVNVFHTDIVSSRLGWTTLTADPATKTVYAHTTAGLVLALDPTGKLLWQRSLTEEFGRVSGYGGRIVTQDPSPPTSPKARSAPSSAAARSRRSASASPSSSRPARPIWFRPMPASRSRRN
jgi:outer membrane protein assembly factor BamB